MCKDCKYFDTAFVGTSFATDFCRKDGQRVYNNTEKRKGCFEKKKSVPPEKCENTQKSFLL